MNLVIPENDSEWREHFKLARSSHKLMLRACTACGLMRYPPSHGCPWCMALELGVEGGERQGHDLLLRGACTTPSSPASRSGRRTRWCWWSSTSSAGSPTPDEALRIIANLVTPDFTPEPEPNVAIGKRVRVVFQDLVGRLRAASVHADRRAGRGPGLALPRLARAARPSHTTPCTARLSRARAGTRDRAPAPPRPRRARSRRARSSTSRAGTRAGIPPRPGRPAGRG